MGNLRKVTTSTNNVANAKLKFGGNQTNEDTNGTNKPVKVSSSISEKIKKLSSSTSSSEISENANTASPTPQQSQQQPSIKNGLNTNGKDKKPASVTTTTTTSTATENGSKSNGTTNGTKSPNAKPALNVLSGNISTYITSEVTASATIKTVNVNDKTSEPSETKIEKKIVINEINPANELPNKEEPLLVTQLDIKPKTTVSAAPAEIKNTKVASKVKVNNGSIPTVVRASRECLDTNLVENLANLAKESDGMKIRIFIRFSFLKRILLELLII